MLLFHALPRLKREGLILSWAEQPLFCLGVHQEVEETVDSIACEAEGVTLMRREGGGSLFLLGAGTLLYQVVVRHRRLGKGGERSEALHVLLAPLLETCRALGLPVEQVAFGRFSVGDRPLFHATLMESNDFIGASAYLHLRPLPTQMLTLVREQVPTLALANVGIGESCETLSLHLQQEAMRRFEGLTPGEVDEPLRREADGLAIRLLSPAWVVDRGRTSRRQSPLAHTGILPRRGCRETAGGTIRATVQFDEDLQRVLSVVFSGDFFVFPTDGLSWLENALENCPRHEIRMAVRRVYRFMPLETPGIRPDDWVEALNLPDD